MKKETEIELSYSVFPYIAKSEWELMGQLCADAKPFFVFVPAECLKRAFKRARIGEKRAEIFRVETNVPRPIRESRSCAICNRLGGSKLYYYKNDVLRCLTDIDKTHAMRVIRKAYDVTYSESDLEARLEQKMRQNEIDAIRADRRAYNTYIRDSRPIGRHKYHKAMSVTCDGKSYSSLGNYVGVKRSGTARVVCKIKF